MKRGDLVTIALQGDFGKPRPALVIQSDYFEELTSTTVLPVTSTLVDAPLLRITIEPSTTNGLRKTSQIMIDKTTTVRREKVGETIGNIDEETMLAVTRSLAVFMGFA